MQSVVARDTVSDVVELARHTDESASDVVGTGRRGVVRHELRQSQRLIQWPLVPVALPSRSCRGVVDVAAPQSQPARFCL